MKLQDCHSGDLAACHRLLSAATAASSSVRCLLTRWSAVSATLRRLSAALPDLAALHSPHLPDLLPHLAETLTLTLALADKCSSPDPISGKLRLQSDLSAASSALHQLAADADVILLSSAPSPEFGGSDAVLSAARGLVTRLQIGSAAARISALDSLLAILCDDDKNAVVAASEGAIPALLRLLDSGGGGGAAAAHEVREKGVAAIARFSAVESCRHQLTAEGGAVLGHLARVLESEGGAAKENACIALQSLTLTKEGAASIGSLGCIAALVEICAVGTPSAQAVAAGVLRNLAAFRGIREKFLDEDVLPVLMRVLDSGTCSAQENVVCCLRNMSDGEESESLKLAIFNAGALECVKNYLDGCDVDSLNVENVVGLLRNLASFRYIAKIIATAGFLPWIIAALDNKWTGARIEAAKAIAEFASVMGRTTKELGEALPLLVHMLEAKATEENDAAVIALASLLSFTAYRKLFKKEERGIANLVPLLDPLVRDVDKKYVISVVELLSHSRKCRKLMVEAGACKFLQRLAGLEVNGAKKLLEILDKGKIWGVFLRT